MKSKIEIEKGNLKMENENRNQEIKMGDWIKSKEYGYGRVVAYDRDGDYLIMYLKQDALSHCGGGGFDFVWGAENQKYIAEHHLKYCRWSVGSCPKRIYPSIKIFTDGKTVTAQYMVGKEILKTAKAVCSPNDEFDYDVGADLALKRLRHEDWLVEMENDKLDKLNEPEVEIEPEIENENHGQSFNWETGNGFLIRKNWCFDVFTKDKVYMFMNFHTLDNEGEYKPTLGSRELDIEWVKKYFKEIEVDY